MTHLNETIYSSCMAGAHQSKPTASGAYLNDEMLSNVAKHNVTRFPFEIARLAQDIAGGLIVTMPSEKDLQNNEIGPLIRKFLQGRDGVEAIDRMRILRLIENMTIGRNAVGYLTESLHGAGSPQAQRIQIARGMKLDEKKARARKLAGIDSRTVPESAAGTFRELCKSLPPSKQSYLIASMWPSMACAAHLHPGFPAPRPHWRAARRNAAGGFPRTICA